MVVVKECTLLEHFARRAIALPLPHSKSLCTWLVAERSARSKYAFDSCRHRPGAESCAPPELSVVRPVDWQECNALRLSQVSVSSVESCIQETCKPDPYCRWPL